MQQKAIQINEKLSQVSDEKKALEKKIRLVEKQVKEQTQLFQQATESTNNEKAKLEQVRTKYNEAFQQLTDCQVENQKLKQELQLSTSTINTLQTTIK